MARPSLQDDLFQVIAHPLRRSLLDTLRRGESPATPLADQFRVSPSVLSQHLSALKDAGLVNERREGRQRIYALRPEPLREIADWVDRFADFWPRKLDALGAHLRAKGKG